LNVYNPGTGSGQISWAPIMGNSYGRNMSLWNVGPTQNSCSSNQDNLSIITNTINNFGYRVDDHKNTIAEATQIPLGTTTYGASGIIEKVDDKDVFRFDFGTAVNMTFIVNPYSVNNNNEGANLDAKVSLLNAAGDTLRVYDSSSVMNIRIDTSLLAGTYFMVVDGTGNINTNNDYGSIGMYVVNGSYELNTVLAIREVKLTGKNNRGKHQLNWTVEADEKIKEYILETSQDGTHFESLAVLKGGNTKQFESMPVHKGEFFYRVKAVTELNSVRYSNILSLQAEGLRKTFQVSNLVRSQIKVLASSDYQYLLYNINGQLFRKGAAAMGSSDIDVSSLPAGMYVLQLRAGNEIISHKIVKQ
jgi:Secretion system C-terminal sorting domain